MRSALANDDCVSKVECASDGIIHLNIKFKLCTMVVICCYVPIMDAPYSQSESYYETLSSILKSISNSHHILLRGDFNSRIGCNGKVWAGELGQEGLGDRVLVTKIRIKGAFCGFVLSRSRSL